MDSGSALWSHYRKIGKVHIVHVDLCENQRLDSCAIDWLSTEERARSERFKVASARRAYVRCRAALRANLCERANCRNETLHFTASERGKLSALCNGEPLEHQFNLSHSKSHGLLAFAQEGQLGVDVEDWDPRRNIDGAIRRVFSETEQAALRAADPEHRRKLFFRLWTIKEALIKATGEGFRRETAAFSAPQSMIEGAKSARFRFPDLLGLQWRLENLECEGFAAALAHQVVLSNHETGHTSTACADTSSSAAPSRSPGT